MKPWPTLVVLGRPASKKNSRRIVTNRRTGKSILADDPTHKAWAKMATMALWVQWRPRPPIDGEVALSLLVAVHPMQRCDLSNVVSAVCDALEAAKVVTNDRRISILRDCRMVRDAARPRVEITLRPAEES